MLLEVMIFYIFFRKSMFGICLEYNKVIIVSVPQRQKNMIKT